MRALAIAATGMSAQQTNVEVIANNIANINTTAFKRARAEFSDLLYQSERAEGVPTRGGENVVPEGARIGLGVHTTGVRNLHAQGSLSQTSNPLDLAINGRGWFQITGPGGETLYTRAGSFNKGPDGTLVTGDGYVVDPQITFPDDTSEVIINQSGEVYARVASQPEPQLLGLPGEVAEGGVALQHGLRRTAQHLHLEVVVHDREHRGVPLVRDPGGLGQPVGEAVVPVGVGEVGVVDADAHDPNLRPAPQPSRAHDQAGDRDQEQGAHPEQPGQPGQARQGVGVGVARPAAPPGLLQLDDGARSGEQEEPDAGVRRQRLDRVAPPPRDHDHGDAGHEHDVQPVEVADLQDQEPEQQHGEPEDGERVALPEQEGTAQAEQRRADVPGERRDDHPRPRRPALRHGQPRGVGVQPDPGQAAAAEQRGHAVRPLVRDRHHVSRHLPRRREDHQPQCQQAGQQDAPLARRRLRADDVLPDVVPDVSPDLVAHGRSVPDRGHGYDRGMTDEQTDEKMEAIQAVVDRVSSWQDGATEGTVEGELRDGFGEAGVEVSDEDLQKLADAIQGEHGAVSAQEVLSA